MVYELLECKDNFLDFVNSKENYWIRLINQKMFIKI